MQAFGGLLQMSERLSCVHALLLSVDEHLQDDVADLIRRTEITQSGWAHACEKVTSLNPFRRTSKREIQQFLSCFHLLPPLNCTLFKGHQIVIK